MTNSWEIVSIQEIGAEFGDAPFGTKLKTKDYVAEGVPVIQGRNIKNNRFEWNHQLYVTEEKFRSLPKNYCREGDLIFPKVGTIGILAIMPKVENREVCLLSTNMMKMSVDSRKADSRYVYYFFSQEWVRKFIRTNAGGSSQPIFNFTTLKAFKLPLPDLPTQRKIAGILSAYDALIENNLRRIKILEEMAQSLYREWFVHFRFPGHESSRFANSSVGRTPKGWDVRSAGELIGFHVGGGWGKEVQDETHSEPSFVIRGTDIPSARLCDRASVPFRYHTESNLRSRRLEVGDIVFEVSGGSKGQPVGRALFISKNLLDSFEGEDVMCASFCKLLRTDTKVIASELFYYHLKEIYEDGRIDQYQVQSTGITNFKFAPFLDQELIVVPPQSLQEKWVRSVAPALQLIQTLGQKCQNLRRTRDLLLSKLLVSKTPL